MKKLIKKSMVIMACVGMTCSTAFAVPLAEYFTADDCSKKEVIRIEVKQNSKVKEQSPQKTKDVKKPAIAKPSQEKKKVNCKPADNKKRPVCVKPVKHHKHDNKYFNNGHNKKPAKPQNVAHNRNQCSKIKQNYQHKNNNFKNNKFDNKSQNSRIDQNKIRAIGDR